MFKLLPRELIKMISCPICDTPTKMFGKKGVVDYFECRNCKTISQYPSPSKHALKLVYNKYAFVNKDVDFILAQNKFYLQKIKLLKKHFKNLENMSILDYGAGAGEVVKYMQENGFNIKGFEPFEGPIKIAKKIGVKLYKSLKQINQKFDLIIMFDVIEHVPNPKKTITAISQYLNPGGYIYLETPNAGDAFVKLYGAKWQELRPNEHLNLLTKKGLKILLKDLNLVKSFGSGHLDCLNYLLYSSYSKIVGKRDQFKKLGGNMPQLYLQHKICVICQKPG